MGQAFGLLARAIRRAPMSPVRVKPPAVIGRPVTHHLSRAAVRPDHWSCCPVDACGNRSGVSKGVWARSVHTPGSVHRTDRSRRGSWWRGERLLATSSYACRRGSVEHQLLCARVRAVTNLPTVPPLKPGRPRPTHPCTGPVVSAWGRPLTPPASAAPPRPAASLRGHTATAQ